jgi:hypothetical protein
MIQFIDIIAANIKRFVPQMQTALYLARIDDEGRVLIQSTSNQNEFVYGGLKDNQGDYFYIRHRDTGEIYYSESSDSKIMTCNQSKVVSRYELKVVACLRNGCPYTLEDNLKRALMTANFPDVNETQPVRQLIRNVGVMPVKSVIDSIGVLKEESPKPKQFDKNLIFVSMEFDLTFETSYF